MKKFFLVLAGLLLITGIAFSQISFKLTGGMAYISGNDLNKGIQGFNDWLTAEASNVTGKYDKLNMGMNFAGEVIYNLSPNMGIGVGVEYFQMSKDNSVSYSLSGFPGKETLKPTVKVMPITLNFYYYIPTGSSMSVYLKAGAGYYMTKFDVESSWSSIFGGGTDTLKVSKGAIGFQGGFGIEVPVSGQVSFVVEAGGRYAKLSELSGDWTSKGNTIFGPPWDKSGTGYLWFGNYSSGGTNYPWIAINDTCPSWVHNGKKASLDLTGFTVKAGIKIGF